MQRSAGGISLSRPPAADRLRRRPWHMNLLSNFHLLGDLLVLAPTAAAAAVAAAAAAAAVIAADASPSAGTIAVAATSATAAVVLAC